MRLVELRRKYTAWEQVGLHVDDDYHDRFLDAIRNEPSVSGQRLKELGAQFVTTQCQIEGSKLPMSPVMNNGKPTVEVVDGGTVVVSNGRGKDRLPFDSVISTASSAFLIERLEEYSKMTREQVECFIADHLWEPFENMDAKEVHEIILDHAEQITQGLV